MECGVKSPSQKGLMQSNETSCHGRKETLIITAFLRNFIDIYEVGKQKGILGHFFPALKFLGKN